MKTLQDSDRKPLFRRGPGLGLKLLILLCVIGGLLYADLHRRPAAQTLRQWTAAVIRPFTWLSTLPHAFDHIGTNFESRAHLLEENAALRRKNLKLSGELLRMRSLEAENQRIRELLSASSTIHQKVLIAEILETSQDPYRHQIVIDKGARQGVYRGQALIDAYGVVGQVIRVDRNTAIALLITDPDNGIPVEINRTGLQTVALGRGDGQSLSLPFLPGNADVHVGDLLVSSGLGGRFPEGYPVGRIREIKHPPGESFMEAIADPAAHLNRSRQVLLVWNAGGVPTTRLPHLPINPRSTDRPPQPGSRAGKAAATHRAEHAAASGVRR